MPCHEGTMPKYELVVEDYEAFCEHHLLEGPATRVPKALGELLQIFKVLTKIMKVGSSETARFRDSGNST